MLWLDAVFTNVSTYYQKASFLILRRPFQSQKSQASFFILGRPFQSQKTQDFATLSDERRARSKIFLLFNTVKRTLRSKIRWARKFEISWDFANYFKGELQRQNKLISPERSFEILQNETKIVKIRQAVLEIFNFKDLDLDNFPRKNDWKTENVVF